MSFPPPGASLCQRKKVPTSLCTTTPVRPEVLGRGSRNIIVESRAGGGEPMATFTIQESPGLNAEIQCLLCFRGLAHVRVASLVSSLHGMADVLVRELYRDQFWNPLHDSAARPHRISTRPFPVYLTEFRLSDVV
jgi:hypothetical protein